MTLAEFIKLNAITITSVPVALRETDKPKSFRYKVEIHYAGKAVPVDYFCGSGWIGRYIPERESAHGTVIGGHWKHATEKELKDYENKIFKGFMRPIPPQISDVMQCLHSEYSFLENSPFWPEYASEFGYNVDSISERNKYDECVNQYIKFRKVFGYQKTKEFVSCEME